MRLQFNDGMDNHSKLLTMLIAESERVVLCSGWLKSSGLERLLPSISHALENQAKILIYSNKKHTQKKAVAKLAALSGVIHIIADSDHRYLHSKIFYFERGQSYQAIIGSANVTTGGLDTNEELSVHLSGMIGDSQHQQIGNYLNRLSAALKVSSIEPG